MTGGSICTILLMFHATDRQQGHATLNLESLKTALALAVTETSEEISIERVSPSESRLLPEIDWFTAMCGIRRPSTAPKFFSGFSST